MHLQDTRIDPYTGRDTSRCGKAAGVAQWFPRRIRASVTGGREITVTVGSISEVVDMGSPPENAYIIHARMSSLEKFTGGEVWLSPLNMPPSQGLRSQP